MSVAYHFDRALNLLEVRAYGIVTVCERALLVDSVTNDLSLPPAIPILIDVSAISNAPSIDDVPKMARLLERLAVRFRSRIAYFVTGVGIVTPYMLASAQVDERVARASAFMDRKKAIEWLNADRRRGSGR